MSVSRRSLDTLTWGSLSMTTQDILGVTVMVLAILKTGYLLWLYIKDMHNF